MGRKRISQLDSWAQHEARVLEVLRKALELLQQERNLPQGENQVNRKLLNYVRHANRDLLRKRKGVQHPIIYQAANQPDPEDEEKAEREDKIPDFTWGMIDHLSDEIDRSDHFFVIECKRLGNPPSSSWKLNKNYVEHGIVRFVNTEHGYGRGEKSGLMIGYVQSMELDEILGEVNGCALSHSIDEVRLLDSKWQVKGVSKLNEAITRSFTAREFSLHHLWVDLR